MSTAIETINTPAVIRQVRSLAQIECEIATEVRRLKRSKLALGRLLLEARGQVPHGQWEPWVTEHGIKPQSAWNYMRLAKSPNLGDLPDEADPTYREAEADDPKAVHYSAKSVEWLTPPEIVRCVLKLFSEIDIDPCSNSKADPHVPAKQHYTREDDGLSLPWHGRVYMNPPYGRDIDLWCGKLTWEHHEGRTTEAVALLPARTETAWFGLLYEVPICLIEGRLKFSGHENSAPFPSLLAYLGPRLDRFAGACLGLGRVYVPFGAQ
jgi:hypothetical protein